MTPSLDDQIALLSRGTADIVPRSELKVKLEKSAKSGRPLSVKLGLDPTAPDIHLGFAVVLRKLRQFQDLGHTVVIIIGDYTALIGDPSGRSSTRPMLSSAEISANAATYVEQLTRILDRQKTVVRFNSEWLGKLSFADLVSLASKMTVAQVLAREDFHTRYAANQPISLHELLYPLAQAYDSVAIEADIEMGGLDQTFNILAGRHLQEQMGQEAQVALFMPLLVGLDGVKKMSKSLGNYVGIGEPPGEMFGKLMSLSDELMPTYFELNTDVAMDDVQTLTDAAQTHPREAKKRLAREIVKIYHGQDSANAAEDDFERVHGKNKDADAVPDDIPKQVIPKNWGISPGKDNPEPMVYVVLVQAGFASSNSRAKDMIREGAVFINGKRISHVDEYAEISDGTVLRYGKKRFMQWVRRDV